MDIPWEFRCLFWWKNLVKKKPEPPLIKINNNENGINSILFLLPNKKEYAQIINYLIKPEKELPEHTIHYVCHKDALPYYPLGLHKNFITFGDDNLNQMGIINNEPFLDRVRTLNNDALIDLNITFNPATTMLAWESKNPLKIGFQSSISDKLYTIILENKGNGYFEKNFKTIEQLLGLS